MTTESLLQVIKSTLHEGFEVNLYKEHATYEDVVSIRTSISIPRHEESLQKIADQVQDSITKTMIHKCVVNDFNQELAKKDEIIKKLEFDILELSKYKTYYDMNFKMVHGIKK